MDTLISITKPFWKDGRDSKIITLKLLMDNYHLWSLNEITKLMRGYTVWFDDKNNDPDIESIKKYLLDVFLVSAIEQSSVSTPYKVDDDYFSYGNGTVSDSGNGTVSDSGNGTVSDSGNGTVSDSGNGTVSGCRNDSDSYQSKGAFHTFLSRDDLKEITYQLQQEYINGNDNIRALMLSCNEYSFVFQDKSLYDLQVDWACAVSEYKISARHINKIFEYHLDHCSTLFGVSSYKEELFSMEGINSFTLFVCSKDEILESEYFSESMPLWKEIKEHAIMFM